MVRVVTKPINILFYESWFPAYLLLNIFILTTIHQEMVLFVVNGIIQPGANVQRGNTSRSRLAEHVWEAQPLSLIHISLPV